MHISNELRVGIMFLTGLILFVLVIVTLTRWGQDRNTYSIEMYFRQAQGIADGAVVRVAGVQVGRVTGIDFDSVTNRAVLTTRINRSVRLYEKYAYTIGIGGLVGERYVEIRPAEGERGALLIDGSQVEGTETADMNDILASANTLVTQLSKSTSGLNDILGNPKNRHNVEQMLANLNRSSEQAANFTDTLNQLAAQNRASIDLIVNNLRDVSNDVRMVSNSLAPQLAKSDILNNLEAAAENISSLTERFDSIAELAENAFNDKELANDLKSVLANFTQASNDLRAITEQVKLASTSLPKAAANLEKASADLPEITRPFRQIAPETAENIRQVSMHLRQTSEQIGGLVSKVGGAAALFGSLKVQPQARAVQLLDKDHTTRTELNLDVATKTGLFRVGVVNDNHTTFNLQAGNKLQDNLWLRYGLVQSRVGLGLDYQPDNNLRLTTELFDPNNLRGNLTADVRLNPLGKSWWLNVGWYNVFKHDMLGVGLSYRP